MNSLDFDAFLPPEDAILHALRAGQAEEPEKEGDLILHWLGQLRLSDPGSIYTILRDLADGLSPYHVIGEYLIPNTHSTILTPHDVMPPGSVTRDIIAVIQEVAQYSAPPWLADIGCGTGILGIAAMTASPDSRGIFIDPDKAACEATLVNLTRLRLTGRSIVMREDSLPDVAVGGLGLLVGNLPFVPRDEIASLPPRFSRYTPRCAVDGGHDGFDVFRRVLPQIHNSVKPGGHIILQVGTGQRESIFAMLGAGWDITPKWAQAHPNVIVATRLASCGSMDSGVGQAK